MRPYLLIAAVLAAFSYAPSAATSPSICDSRDTLVAYLAVNHGERRVAAGIDGDGLLLEVFVAAGGSRGLDAQAAMGGSWSILLTRPNGMICMVAAGHGWTFFSIAVGKET